MKLRHLYFVLLPLILASFGLSACAGGMAATGWPGLTVTADTAYVSYNQYVYAINLANGTENWRFPTQPIRSATFFAPPAVNEESQVAVGSYAQSLLRVKRFWPAGLAV